MNVIDQVSVSVLPADTPAAIEVAHLTKVYKQVRAVDGISFSIARGSTTGLLGGNGAGKTTTIAMIMGLVLPTSGRVRVLGHEMTGWVERAGAHGLVPAGTPVLVNPALFCGHCGLCRRDLPQLLAQKKLLRKWVCYRGDERIGIASTKLALMRDCLKRGWNDDEFIITIIEPQGLIEEEELEPPDPSQFVEEEGCP